MLYFVLYYCFFVNELGFFIYVNIKAGNSGHVKLDHE